jgi:hypothetical protein
MSVSQAAQTPPQASGDAAPAPDYSEDDDRGYGWVAFAGTLLLIVGTINGIEGIAAATPTSSLTTPTMCSPTSTPGAGSC